MAKVKTIVVFHDLVDETLRQIGDVFECSQERADVLNQKGLVQILESEKKEAKIAPTENKVVKPNKTK